DLRPLAEPALPERSPDCRRAPALQLLTAIVGEPARSVPALPGGRRRSRSIRNRGKRGENAVQKLQKITPCLWFDGQAEEAAKFYTSIFPNSKIGSISRYGEVGRELHGQTPGCAMTVAFELDGQPFTGLNGGPAFRFNEAISFQIQCETQEEVD